MRTASRLFGFVLALCLISTSTAFTTRSPLHRLQSFITILHFAQSDFDVIIGDDNEAGQALALEFSREVQLRKEQAQAQKTNRRLLSEEELRFLNNKPFVKRQQVITGQVKEIGTSAGFFSGRGQSVYSFPLDAPPSNTPQESNFVIGGAISPLFLPTMAAIVLLSVYLTFSVVPDTGTLEVQDWNTVKDVTVEQVMPPSVYL